MRGEGLERELRPAGATVELVGEEQVGQLGPPVRRPAAVAARLAARVVELSGAVRVALCMCDETVTTRPSLLATSWGSSRPVSRNGPKWLVAIWSSRPSTVRWCEVPITPALLTSTSIAPTAAIRAAARRTELRSARSSTTLSRLARGAARRIDASASSSRLSVRPASTRRAPRRASSRAVWWPIPPTVGPVTTIVRPDWSGRSVGRHTSTPARCGAIRASRGRRRRPPGRAPGPR